MRITALIFLLPLCLAGSLPPMPPAPSVKATFKQSLIVQPAPKVGAFSWTANYTPENPEEDVQFIPMYRNDLALPWVYLDATSGTSILITNDAPQRFYHVISTNMVTGKVSL